ncbi:ATP-binding protein [Chitinophagaceae bacterium LB-8]|uniref:ATP-binding protein n=1 Tax=Paraflavisolibacter caeni TaxID=2982496 RepID=A0A9X2XYL6_9BACT|nr:AAA family ATPase [Paraflavisolibacter caeni]MCU7551786.1 ATP-binding protein [Paraflavisolibacter caeni]
MELQIAKRKQAKIKLGIQGCSGSGKTMGALLIAYGLCSDWGKIAVIDTENYSASLYAHLGGFSVVNIAAPFSPEKYIDAIRLCETAGMEVIIIDSISHEWEGSGGILDIHGNMAGNSFTNWSKITPRHNAFVQAILQSTVHIIGTIRSKQEYVLNEKNGKQVPEKVGMKGVQRDGLDYEFTIVLDVDIKHHALASKDRTGLFMDKPEFRITTDTGRLIQGWCGQGIPIETKKDEFTDRINACNSIAELGRLYILCPQYQQSHNAHFSRRKRELQPVQPIVNNLLTQNISTNGNGSIQQP